MEIVRVAAIQASAEKCRTEYRFHEKIDTLVRSAVHEGAKIVVFPEDIGFWIMFAQDAYRVRVMRQGRCFATMAVKTGWRHCIELAVNWIFDHIHMNFFGEWLAQARIKAIIHRTFTAVARKYDVVVIAGSAYVREPGGMYNESWVYDRNGSIAGAWRKHELVAIEESWGIQPGVTTNAIHTQDYCIGLCLCADLNNPTIVAELARDGAQLICAPSGGWRPYPGYPYDASDEPQLQRAQEVGLAIVRPYSAGWLGPGLFFEGHTEIVAPTGRICANAGNIKTESVVIADVPVPSL